MLTVCKYNKQQQLVVALPLNAFLLDNISHNLFPCTTPAVLVERFKTSHLSQMLETPPQSCTGGIRSPSSYLLSCLVNRWWALTGEQLWKEYFIMTWDIKAASTSWKFKSSRWKKSHKSVKNIFIVTPVFTNYNISQIIKIIFNTILHI